MNTKTFSLASLFALAAAACGDTSFTTGTSAPDTGTPPEDSAVEARVPARDTGLKTPKDTGTPCSDAEADSKTSSSSGSGTGSSDAGGFSSDAGCPDAGHEASSSDGSLGSESSGSSGSGSSSSSDAGTSEGGSGSGSGDGGLEDASTDSPTEDASTDSPMTCTGTIPKCSGPVLLTCGDGGLVATLCTGATPVCLDVLGVGACVACQPGTLAQPNTQCDPASWVATPTLGTGTGYFTAIQTCDAEGQWASALTDGGTDDPCSPATPICSGAPGSASCGGVCVPGTNQCVTRDFGGYTKGQQVCGSIGQWGQWSDVTGTNIWEEGWVRICETSTCNPNTVCWAAGTSPMPDAG
jgi:hypothetical protein